MATTRLMTVEHYRELPEDGPFYHELRRGELVPVPRPKLKYALIQERLRELLKQIFRNSGVAMTEFAFRALPEHGLRVADVAYVVRERMASANLEDNLFGAPDNND
jgi:Uma2 family endonuclease